MILKRGKRYEVRLWVADPDAKGGRRKASFGTYATRGEAREAEAQAMLKRASRPRGQRDWTIAQFYERWQRLYPRPVEATNKHNRDALGLFIDRFGKRRLSDFGSADAKDFAAEWEWRAKVASALFEDAIRDGKLDVNPFRGLNLRKGVGRRHIDPLTASEVERLAVIAEEALGFYGPHFAAFIRVLAWTGMRPGELCRLEWADVDWDAGTITIRTSKTKQPRVITLARAAREALSTIAPSGPRVFHTSRGAEMRGNSYRWYWGQVRAVFEGELRADHWLKRRLVVKPNDHLDAYELRHFCGSYLASRGLSAWEIAEHLGNSARVCEQTYVHPYRSQVRDRVRAAFDDDAEAQVGHISMREAR